MKAHQNRQYGWRPDKPDQRDLLYKPQRKVVSSLPAAVDLRPQCPPVLDQGELGSCTANAIASAHRFDQMAQRAKAIFPPSRLFIYYNERAIERTVKTDAGAELRDGIKTLAKQGACDEALWPYDVAKFARKPSSKAYKAALKSEALLYERIDNSQIDAIRACLASGFPFVIGFQVYSTFESDAVAKTGVVPMPGLKEQAIGGHAVLVVGYDDKSGRLIVQNSWGTEWGQDGFFTIPYEYFTNKNLADDAWKITRVAA